MVRKCGAVRSNALCVAGWGEEGEDPPPHTEAANVLLWHRTKVLPPRLVKRCLTLNGQRDLHYLISGGGSCKPSVTQSLAPTTSCVYKEVRGCPPVACDPHSRPSISPYKRHHITAELYNIFKLLTLNNADGWMTGWLRVTHTSSPLHPTAADASPQTFCVVSKRFRKNYIHRFTATSSFFYFSPWNSVRRTCIFLSTNQMFDYVVMTTILLNCVFLAMTETVEEAEYIFLAIYTAEMSIKSIAKGFILNKYTYLRNPWNWLDFVVITSGYATIGMEVGNLAGLRTFRVLRALKTVSIMPGLKTIINALLHSFKQLAEVMTLTIFCLMVFALFALQVYMGELRNKCVKVVEAVNGSDIEWHQWVWDEDHWLFNVNEDPVICGNTTGARHCPEGYFCVQVGENPNHGYTNFDNFLWSMLTTFQLITLDYWENVYNMAESVMDVWKSSATCEQPIKSVHRSRPNSAPGSREVLASCGPMSVVFFTVVVFFGSFYLINLMLAVVALSYEEEAEITQEEISGAVLSCFQEISGDVLSCSQEISGDVLSCSQEISDTILSCSQEISDTVLSCSEEISDTILSYSQEISDTILSCSQEISDTILLYSQEISDTVLSCFQEISGDVLSCSQEISDTILSCSQEISDTILSCSQEISHTVFSCSQEISGDVLSCSQEISDTNLSCSQQISDDVLSYSQESSDTILSCSQEISDTVLSCSQESSGTVLRCSQQISDDVLSYSQESSHTEKRKDLTDHRDDSTFSFDPSNINVKQLEKNKRKRLDSRKGVLLASYTRKKTRRRKRGRGVGGAGENGGGGGGGGGGEIQPPGARSRSVTPSPRHSTTPQPETRPQTLTFTPAPPRSPGVPQVPEQPADTLQPANALGS
uniref:Ion transport domain-containing protein n=1 Tax=Timema genevievae TaxID=629358 RepID=A0A7R9PKK8_TIMGE|nr:unnamed protein product [Timema genevievae]